MNVLEQTPQCLKLYQSPFKLRLWGGLSLLFGILLGLFLADSAQLTCQRTADTQQGQCQLRQQSWLLHMEQREFPLSQLRGARLGISTGDESDTYRVELQLGAGYEPLISSYSSGKAGKEAIVETIQNFVHRPDIPDIDVIQDERLFALLFGLAFALPGLLINLFGSSLTLTFDRRDGAILLEKQNLLGNKQTVRPLEDFSAAELEESNSSDSTTYRIVLHFHHNDSLPLSRWHSNVAVKQKQQAVWRMNQFMKNKAS